MVLTLAIFTPQASHLHMYIYACAMSITLEMTEGEQANGYRKWVDRVSHLTW